MSSNDAAESCSGRRMAGAAAEIRMGAVCEDQLPIAFKSYGVDWYISLIQLP